ncbi:Thioredoxin [Halomicrobium zhouii]|uniref:Thioredoxin n=1 Tax=Halomicrobium zhouii TaxID=767519 RepID=A0A1I6KQW9_9EURY|nr:thioredoxin family protein [Halomicrobium zhouii]SFR93645.1 Thioredoxin [Halomicrobium zhouii]
MNEAQVDSYVDALVAKGVLVEDDVTGELATTDEFEQDRHVYYDTYLDVTEAEFHQAVADTFGFDSAEAAAEHVERHEVTREEFATYLTLYATLEDCSVAELAEMASIVTEVGPQSPVPESVVELDDECYGDFLTTHNRAVVTVWKRGCAPCDAMKEELDDVLAAFPGDARVAGLDGEQCPGFCKEYEVNAAPAVVLFEDCEMLDVRTGRTKPETLAEWAADVYDVE